MGQATTEHHQRVYRAAIIGCGRIGADCGPPGAGSSRIASHAAAYTACGRTRLVAVADPDPDCLRRCGERWRVPGLYRDPAELFEREQVDLVSICTPPVSHVQLLTHALQNDNIRGILMEKPLAPDLEGAAAALEVAERSAARVGVNYIRRFPPLYRQVAGELQGGGLGSVQHVNVLYTRGIVNNGSHAFDLLRFFFGDPARVSLLSAARESGPDPTLDVRVEFPAGFEAWLCGMDGEAYNVFQVDILGSLGRVTFSDQGHALERFTVEDTRSRHGFRQLQPAPQSRPTDLGRAVEYAVEDLVRSIEAGSPPACTLGDAYAALELSLRVLGEGVASKL